MNKRNQLNWKIPMEEEKKQEGLRNIGRAVQQKRIRLYPSFFSCFLEQIRFQTLGEWFTQAGILLAALLLSGYLRITNGAGTELLTAVSVFTALAGNLSLAGVSRVFSWHMTELSQTLYLDLKQMISIRMVCSGLLDLIFISLLIGLLGSGQSAGIQAFTVYLLVPFLWSNVCYLQTLTICRGGIRGYRQLTTGLLSAVLALFPALVPGAYERTWLLVWVVLLAAGAGCLAASVGRLYGRIERGDMICQN